MNEQLELELLLLVIAVFGVGALFVYRRNRRVDARVAEIIAAERQKLEQEIDREPLPPLGRPHRPVIRHRPVIHANRTIWPVADQDDRR